MFTQRHLTSYPYRCTLADFQIEKKIGRGQFSEVYKATCLLDRKPVALKKVQIFEMMDAKARQDCIKEIDLLKDNAETVPLFMLVMPNLNPQPEF
uniref:Serine/threonine-protein kinase Nek6 n=1 Tax=Sphaerodactylus townsendi TaxID=933632 RepID=A0ACB8EZA4_9SAUR